MSSSVATCANCGAVVNDTGDAPRQPCVCGSTKRTFHETLEDTVVARDSYRARAKRPSFASDKRLRWDSYSAVEMCHDLGRMVRVERTIDKDADRYDETVTDLATAEVIYECHELLSQHRNRGTAKPPRRGMTGMTRTLTWHVAPLRAWVIRTHGDEQWRRVNECLQSVFERQEFAKYHHGEVRRLLHDPLAELPHFDRVGWILGAEVEGMEETFGPVRFKAAAHVLATVQSMHALVDALAQVLRYVFALPSNDPEYAPPAKKVHENLPDGRIKDLLGELIQHPEGEYLEALSNRSKHHSIVDVGYSVPMNEGGEEGLMWRAFTNKRKRYPARPVRDTLVAEFQRQQDVLFAILAELDAIAAGP